MEIEGKSISAARHPRRHQTAQGAGRAWRLEPEPAPRREELQQSRVGETEAGPVLAVPDREGPRYFIELDTPWPAMPTEFEAGS